MKKKHQIQNKSSVQTLPVRELAANCRTLAKNTGVITRDSFWQTIEKVKDFICPEILLAAALRNYSLPELISFRDHFDALVDQANSWKLWGAADLICGGCSDDGFEYFRYGLIAMGRKVFESALKNPDSLAKTHIDTSIQNELFGYVAGWVYEMLSGGQPMPDNNSRRYRREPFGQRSELGEIEQYRRRMPKLWAKHGEECERALRG